MNYEGLVKIVKDAFEGADAGKVNEHVAIQFNVTGEAEGAFYAEVKEGKVFVEPYEYYDRDAIITADGQVIADIVNGKLGLEAAFGDGKIGVEGNTDKALLLKEFIQKNVKAAAKKAPAKKAPAKKEAAKAPAKKAPAKKEAAKAPAKKAPAKKDAAKAPAKKAPAKKESK